MLGYVCLGVDDCIGPGRCHDSYEAEITALRRRVTPPFRKKASRNFGGRAGQAGEQSNLTSGLASHLCSVSGHLHFTIAREAERRFRTTAELCAKDLIPSNR